MTIKYECIKAEFKRLGLTNKKVASLLGISVQALDKRIINSSPSIHWIVYGLSTYYSGMDRDEIKRINRET